MKKFLCLILSFLLIITSVTVSPAKVKATSENYTDDYVFGEKDFFSASDTANDKDMTFTATEDGLYSVRIKTIEGFNNLSIAKDPDGNEIKPYARDYRIGDRTRIDYYQLKKGQVFTIKFMLHANSSALIIADIVREISKDDEFNFTGEYDVSYYYNPSKDYHYYKLGCLMDTDDNGNNVLNARVRYFQNENNDELDYLNVPDVYMNNILSSMRPNSSTLCIINFYSHGTSYSSKDASTAQSKIKFIRMENSSGIDINQPDEPFNLIENQNGEMVTNEFGHSYFKYAYSYLSFIKSYTIHYSNKDMEFPANSHPTTEKNPYSPYTGYYLTPVDSQDTNHWAVGSDNTFLIRAGYYEEKIPVTIKTYDQLDRFMFFGDTTLKLKPNAPLRRSLSFTPPEDGPYTLFVTVDSHSDSCNDTIAFNTTDHSLNRDFPDQTTKLANGKTLYEYRNLTLEKGTKYTFDCYLIHSDSEASDETVNMTFNFKNPAIISSFSLNQTGLDPVLVDGIDNISGSYKYSLPDYVNSVDVTYTDGTVVKYTYDEASDSYTTDAPAKYTVYPLTIENPNDWSSGYNSVYFNIDGKSKSLTFTVYDNERFEYNLNTIGLNETNTVRFYRDDAKSYYKFYRFTPETSGTYNLKMSATPHDNNCRISTYYNVYHNGELVSTNYNTENISPCIFKAGEEYIIKFFGIHKNCDKTDNSNLNTLEPQITIIKVSDDVETSKLTTVPATTIPVTTTTIATTGEVSTTGNGETSGEVVTTPVKTTDNIETTGETVTPVVTTTNGDSINVGTTSNNATNGVVPKPSTTSTSLQPSSSKKPATTKVKKVKATKKSLTIKWSKVKGASGYEIQVATDKKFKKNKKSILVKKQKTTSAKIKKLKSKKKYYVRVRTYKVVGRKKVYSSWINGKATKTK